jgi:DNA-directed RNA polymerase subunit RPC12/RpoP
MMSVEKLEPTQFMPKHDEYVCPHCQHKLPLSWETFYRAWMNPFSLLPLATRQALDAATPRLIDYEQATLDIECPQCQTVVRVVFMIGGHQNGVYHFAPEYALRYANGQ